MKQARVSRKNYTSFLTSGFLFIPDCLDPGSTSRFREVAEPVLLALDSAPLPVPPLNDVVLPIRDTIYRLRGEDSKTGRAVRAVGASVHRLHEGDVGTPWVQSWPSWNHWASRLPEPCLLQAVLCASKLSKRSGAIRVLPGSHRRWNEAHGRLQTLGSETLPGEATIELEESDLLLLDARLLRATAPVSGPQKPYFGVFNFWTGEPRVSLLPATLDHPPSPRYMECQ